MKRIFEMAYPASFNMDEFKSLRSYSERVEYCNNKLERLGSGSARIVYKIDDEKCLKLAKNKKGVAQNEEEISLANSGYFDFLTTCYAYDQDSQWCEMTLAKKVTKAEWKKITGQSFDLFQYFVQREKNDRVRSIKWGFYRDSEYEEIIDTMQEDEEYEYSIFNQVSNFIADCQLESVGDIGRISSWGKIIDESGDYKLIMIDFGLTDEIYDKYYKRKGDF